MSVVRCAVVAACALAVLVGCAEAASYPTFSAALNANAAQFSQITATLNKLKLTAAFSNAKLAATVFVPTDAAFTAIQKQTGLNINSLSNRILSQVVNYHIAKPVLTTTAMKGGQALPTYLTNASLKVVQPVSGKPAGSVAIQGVGSVANIIPALANIKCGAGYAHGIDKVLLPIRV